MTSHKCWALVFTVTLLLCATQVRAHEDEEESGSVWSRHNSAGREAFERGDYAEAEKEFSAALKEAESLAPEDPSVVVTLNNLAFLFRRRGKFAEAEPLYRRALEINEKSLGPENPVLAVTLSNLAELCRAQKKYGEAESLYQRALAIREKVLQPGDPAVAVTLSNMASLYRFEGKLVEAEPLYRRALEIFEKAMDPDDPIVATEIGRAHV